MFWELGYWMWVRFDRKSLILFERCDFYVILEMRHRRWRERRCSGSIEKVRRRGAITFQAFGGERLFCLGGGEDTEERPFERLQKLRCGLEYQ